MINCGRSGHLVLFAPCGDLVKKRQQCRVVNWFADAIHNCGRLNRLEPIRKVAITFKRHVANILTYCHHPITNGVAEGLNSRIMTIKRKACGYRNKENFKTAIYFFCGGLDLYPQ